MRRCVGEQEDQRLSLLAHDFVGMCKTGLAGFWPVTAVFSSQVLSESEKVGLRQRTAIPVPAGLEKTTLAMLLTIGVILQKEVCPYPDHSVKSPWI